MRRQARPETALRIISVSQAAIVRDVLPNGLRILTERMPHVRSVSIGVWLARGSRHEPQEQSGIAHFVEHMLFKGTATRTAEDIAQTIDSIGGQMDAFTAKESCVQRGGYPAREEGGPRRDQDGGGHA